MSKETQNQQEAKMSSEKANEIENGKEMSEEKETQIKGAKKMSNKNLNEIEEEKEMNEEVLMQNEKGEESSSLWVKLENGSFKDLNSDYSLDESLSIKQKLFCFWMGYPFSEAKGNAALSAHKAGFAVKSAKVTASRMLKDPAILKQIKHVQDKSLGEEDKMYVRRRNSDVLKRKYKILDMNVCSFYEEFQENGETKIRAKPLSELTSDQKNMIEGIYHDAKGNIVYKLPSKSATETELLKLFRNYQEKEKEEEEDLNMSRVYDLVKTRIDAKIDSINKNKEEDVSDFRESSPEAEAQKEV